MSCRRYFLNIGKLVEDVAFIPSVGFLVKMLQYILGNQLHTLRCLKSFFAVNVPNLLIINVLIQAHSPDIIYPERQHVFVIDGIHNGIGMQPVTEGLLSSHEMRIGYSTSIDGKDWRTSKAKDMVLLEILDDGSVHITELAAMALIKYNDYMLLENRVSAFLLDEGGKLLDGSDDDFGIGISQLLFQHGGGAVAIGSSLLEAVILLHGLVVQVLAVNHEQHFVDVGQAGSQLGGLERGKGFAASRGVPDITAPGNSAILLVVVGNLDAVQDTLRSRNLIWPHHHQHILSRKYAVFGQYIQQGMLGKESPGKVHQVSNHPVAGIGPERGELKAVAGLALPAPTGIGCFLHGIESGAVGIILGIGAIGNHENLHILKKP